LRLKYIKCDTPFQHFARCLIHGQSETTHTSCSFYKLYISVGPGELYYTFEENSNLKDTLEEKESNEQVRVYLRIANENIWQTFGH